LGDQRAAARILPIDAGPADMQGGASGSESDLRRQQVTKSHPSRWLRLYLGVQRKASDQVAGIVAGRTHEPL
jgi:hypothetical protein